jgi:hypothetical protein
LSEPVFIPSFGSPLLLDFLIAGFVLSRRWIFSGFFDRVGFALGSGLGSALPISSPVPFFGVAGVPSSGTFCRGPSASSVLFFGFALPTLLLSFFFGLVPGC